MTEEIIDIFDEDMKHIGTAPRSQAHLEGLWHMAFHCWILSRDPQGKEVVWLQLRSKTKKDFPGLLDISAAGHLDAGEKPEDGIREIEEELGMTVTFDQLTYLFTGKLSYHAGNFFNQEFTPTYFLETQQPLSSLKPDPVEVDGVYEAQISDVLALFEHKVDQINIHGIEIQSDHIFHETQRTARISDFVVVKEEYYVRIMNLAHEHFQKKQ